MKNNLQKFSTADEYPNATLTWPKIPDATGMASSFIKVRAAKEKKENYENIWKNHFKNRTKLEEDEKNLSPTFNSGRRKRSTNPAINDVLNATSGAKNQFTICMNLLNDSIAKVDLMIQNLLTPTTTTLSTSTSGFGTTLTETTTTPKPFCWSKSDVKDSLGQYIKTICMVPLAQIYSGAVTVCQSRLMNLYAITSQVEMTAVYSFMWKVANLNGAFIINGQWDGSNWIVSNPDPKNIYSGAVPASGTGNCLVAVKLSSGTTTAQADCNVGRWFICEGNLSSNYFL